MLPLKPEKEGVRFLGPTLDARGCIKKYALATGRAKTLGEMTSDFTFFTPAPLYLGGFIDAPLIDFMFEMGEEVRFYFRKFGRPIFSGLEARSNGNPDWNFVIWAIRRHVWQAFNNFVVSLTMKCADSRTVFGVGEQDLVVVDPLAVETHTLVGGVMPSLCVTGFGVNGSEYRSAFVSDGTSLPRLRYLAPDSSMRIFADAFYRGDNPVDAKNRYKPGTV